MEDDFGTYLIQVARNRATRYSCAYCDEIFPTENGMVQHLRSPELDGGHVTGMLNTYNNLNGFLAAARPPPASHTEEASIGRATSEEVASNSEGEGDDPLCISSAEKPKAIDMELMCPTCKRSCNHKNVVEESTAVACDMKELVPIAEEEKENEFNMLRELMRRRDYRYKRSVEATLEYIPQRQSSLELLSLDALSFSGHTLNFIPQSMSRCRLLSSLCLFPGATLNDILQMLMSSLPLLSTLSLFPGATLNDIPQNMSSLRLLSGATLNDIPQSMSSLRLLSVASNSEGEGDDLLCISSAEKGKARAMELTCSTGSPLKRSLYLKNVVEESTVVAYDMKEHVPIAEEKEEEDVPKVASKICAGNSEGEGDDPLRISSAKKGKAIAMEQTGPMGPHFKKSRHLKDVVEESTAVAYDIKSKPKVLRPSKRMPFMKEKDVPFMLQDNDGFDKGEASGT